MATYDGQIPTATAFASLRDTPRAVASNPTIYYYRTSGGTRASTTSLSLIPAGAVIERVVTT